MKYNFLLKLIEVIKQGVTEEQVTYASCLEKSKLQVIPSIMPSLFQVKLHWKIIQ